MGLCICEFIVHGFNQVQIEKKKTFLIPGSSKEWSLNLSHAGDIYIAFTLYQGFK